MSDSDIIELMYNPYLIQTKIKVFGKTISPYSEIIQYLEQDIYKWQDKLMDLLHKEVNNNFSLIFIGRAEEAMVISYYASQTKFCTSFSHKPFDIDDSLKLRMKKLDEIILVRNIPVFPVSIYGDILNLDGDELLLPTMDFQLETKFLKIKNRLLSNLTDYPDKGSVLFVLDNKHKFSDKLINANKYQFVFVLSKGNSSAIYKIAENIYYIKTNTADFSETLFRCYSLNLLRDAFINAIHESKINRKLRNKLLIVSKRIDILVPNSIEVGKSITVEAISENAYEKNPSITIQCDKPSFVKINGMRVTGLKIGIVTLIFYEVGSIQPITKKIVNIIQRTRITKLILPDEKFILEVGEYHYLQLDYAPSNADNFDKLELYSTDTHIADIGSFRRIIAKNPGFCKIICCVEQVSAQVSIEVRPKLIDIVVDNEKIFEGIEPDTEVELSIHPIPSNALFIDYTITSSNIMVANIIGNKLFTRTNGESIITISEQRHGLVKQFKVKVKTVTQEKKRLLSKIFRKENK